MSALADAATSFEETLAELGISEEDARGTAKELGRRAALLGAAELIWSKHLGPLYTSKQVREVMGRGTRQSVNELARRRRLLSVPRFGGGHGFPAFQFDNDGRPLPGLHAILEVFDGVVESRHTIVSWFVTPDPLLEGRTPAEWLREGLSPSVAVAAARRYAERLRR